MSHFSPTLERHAAGVHVHVEILESNPVVGIGPLEDSLKDHKVVPGDEPLFCAVRNTEERGELSTSYFGQIRLWRDRVHELVDVKKPLQASG